MRWFGTPPKYNSNPPCASSPRRPRAIPRLDHLQSSLKALHIGSGLQNRSRHYPFFSSCSKNCIPFSFVPRSFLGHPLHFVLIFHIALQERAILIFVILIASCCFPLHHTFSLRICRGKTYMFPPTTSCLCCAPAGAAPLHHPTHSLRSLAAPLPRPPVTQHPNPTPFPEEKKKPLMCLALHFILARNWSVLSCHLSSTLPVRGGRQIGHRPQKKQKKSENLQKRTLRSPGELKA